MRKNISKGIFALFVIAGVVAGIWIHNQEQPAQYEDTVAFSSASELYRQLDSIPFSDIESIIIENHSDKLLENLREGYVLVHYRIDTEYTDTGTALPFKHRHESIGSCVLTSFSIWLFGAFLAFVAIWPHKNKEQK